MINKIINYLDDLYPNPQCELNYNSTFQLLIAVVLSAQCTDKRVNSVTKTLFAKYPDAEALAKANPRDIEREIYSLGFYRNKAKNIIALAKGIVENFNGEVPNTLEQLTTLAGVGRKTANVILSLAFGKPALAVDTHVLRVSNRLGLTASDNPNVCENDLKIKLNQKLWSKLHYQLVLFGRYHCTARNPNCSDCQLKNICAYYKEKKCL